MGGDNPADLAFTNDSEKRPMPNTTDLKTHIAKHLRTVVGGLAIGATIGLGTGAMMGLLHMGGAIVLGLHLTPSFAGLLFGAAAGLAIGLFLDCFRSSRRA